MFCGQRQASPKSNEQQPATAGAELIPTSWVIFMAGVAVVVTVVALISSRACRKRASGRFQYARAAIAEPAIANEIVSEIELDEHSIPKGHRRPGPQSTSLTSPDVKYESLPAPMDVHEHDDDGEGEGEGLSREEAMELFSPVTMERYAQLTRTALEFAEEGAPEEEVVEQEITV